MKEESTLSSLDNSLSETSSGYSASVEILDSESTSMVDTVRSEPQTAVSSLLAHLRAPPKSDLARKRKMKSNLPKGIKKVMVQLLQTQSMSHLQIE